MLDLPGCEVSVMFTGGGTNNNSSMDSTKDMVLNERIMGQWLNLVWFSSVPSSSLLIAGKFGSVKKFLSIFDTFLKTIWHFFGQKLIQQIRKY